MTQLAIFDYDVLDVDTRAFVETRTIEIKSLIRRSALDIIDIGQKLTEVKARLGHGNYVAWLAAEFEWSISTAERFVRVTKRFKNRQIDDFAPSALYLLSAPSTSDEAVEEAIERAQNGERITHGAAKQIVSQYKESVPNHINIVDEWGEVETVEIPPGQRLVYDFEPEEPKEDEPVAAQSIEPKWTESELARRGYVENGITVIANMKTDLALIEWAKSMNIFTRVDRATEWGNPFLLIADGERQTVVENYQWYLERKPSLLAKVNSLQGKVLGCWCYPELCHGEILEDYANDTAD